MSTPYEILDPRFKGLVNGNVRLDHLYTGCRWAEGPAWFGAGRYLVWSDIPNNRQLRYDEADGSVSEFRVPANNSNGNTVDRQGRQVTCEHGLRRVTRTEHDGTITVIADRFEGKRFNSPNDVVVKSDNSIWFTDPTYGIDSDYEGHKSESEIGRSNVYRVDPSTGAVTAVITDMVKPNGLAFSRDESQLYVADTGRTHVPQGPAHIRVFDIKDGKAGRVVSLPNARPVSSTASASTSTGASGAAPKMACIATIRTGRSSARSWCRRWSPMSASAASSATASTSAPRPRSMRSM